jgi:hypothetical protein
MFADVLFSGGVEDCSERTMLWVISCDGLKVSVRKVNRPWSKAALIHSVSQRRS